MPSQVDPRENAQRLREQVRKLRAEALRAGDAETRRRLLLQSRETIAEAERACEAIKAANFEGTHRNGGALLLCGDDHAAKERVGGPLDRIDIVG